MHILQIGPFPDRTGTTRGGVEAAVLGTCRALQALGARVSVVAVPWRPDQISTFVDGDIPVTYLSAPLRFHASAILHIPRVLRMIRRDRPAMVHVHSAGLFQTALLAGLRLLRQPCVWTVHGINQREWWQKFRATRLMSDFAHYLFYTMVEKGGLWLAPTVLVDTPYVGEAIRHRNQHVLPIGIFGDELRSCRTSVMPARVRVAAGVGMDVDTDVGPNGQPYAEHPVVLAVGIFHPRKGHHRVVWAFARVHQTHPAARLVIAGAVIDAAYYQAVQDEVDRCGLANAVSLHADLPRSALLALFDSASVFALHSEEESQGIALCEALAMGLPIVATRVGGIPYVVNDGQTGFLIDPHDQDGFVRALSRLLSDPVLRAGMADAARIASKRFEWRQIARSLLRLYVESGARE